jgi:hypothetical protein
LLRERIETADHLKNKIRHRKLKSLNPYVNNLNHRGSLEARTPFIKQGLPAMTEQYLYSSGMPLADGTIIEQKSSITSSTGGGRTPVPMSAGLSTRYSSNVVDGQLNRPTTEGQKLKPIQNKKFVN